jgi:hypothetical protein
MIISVERRNYMELTIMLKMVGLIEDELIGGFITPKKGYYYTVLNRKDGTENVSLFGLQLGLLQLRKTRLKQKASVWRPESNIPLT